MSYRGNLRPRTAELSKHQQEMLLPVIRNQCAAGQSDGEIVAHLAEHGPIAATLYQVRRLRNKAGIVWTAVRATSPTLAPPPPGPLMVEGVREPYVDKIRHLATVEHLTDVAIARRVGLGKHQVWNLRKRFEIPAGRNPEYLRQRRLALVAPPPAPEPAEERTQPARRLKDPAGLHAICCYCSMAVSAYLDDTAIEHMRILPRRRAGGIVRLGPCTGSGRVVRWEADRWAVPVAA